MPALQPALSLIQLLQQTKPGCLCFVQYQLADLRNYTSVTIHFKNECFRSVELKAVGQQVEKINEQQAPPLFQSEQTGSISGEHTKNSKQK